MLFKVRWKKDNQIYTVYLVNHPFLEDECEFFVYDKQKNKWEWLPSDECIPVEE